MIGDAGNKTVLIVDDNKMNIVILSDIVRKEGYEIYSTMDATQVLPMAIQMRPDAILLDIVMPVMDGIEVCQVLKDQEETKNIPIIMVTAITDSEVLRNAFQIGAFDYIKKPYDPIEVVARLQSAVRYFEQQKQLEMLAMKDGLTQLYNHRAILDLAAKEYNRTVRSKKAYAFVMMDIDHFKKVNDTYGHRTGDYVLENIGTILRNITRAGDFVGRYGGEEFCIVLSDQSLEDIMGFSERLRKTVEANAFILNDTFVKVTISIGIAYKDPDYQIEVADLIQISDQELYTAKENGRNRVELQILS